MNKKAGNERGKTDDELNLKKTGKSNANAWKIELIQAVFTDTPLSLSIISVCPSFNFFFFGSYPLSSALKHMTFFLPEVWPDELSWGPW